MPLDNTLRIPKRLGSIVVAPIEQLVISALVADVLDPFDLEFCNVVDGFHGISGKGRQTEICTGARPEREWMYQ